jgi:hypothetical protein
VRRGGRAKRNGSRARLSSKTVQDTGTVAFWTALVDVRKEHFPPSSPRAQRKPSAGWGFGLTGDGFLGRENLASVLDQIVDQQETVT